MRKLLSILLAAMLLVGCMAFASAEEADALLGVWYAQTLEAEGMTMSAGDVGFFGVLTINADGTFTLAEGEDEAEAGAWQNTDGALTMTLGEEALSAALLDGALSLEADGTKIVFGREAPVASYTPAEKAAVEDVAAFNGTWNAWKIAMEGMMVDADHPEMVEVLEMLLGEGSTSMTIENGTVHFGTEPLDFVFKDSALSTDDESGITQTITLLEDGVLCYDMLGTLQLYFQNAATAE